MIITPGIILICCFSWTSKEALSIARSRPSPSPAHIQVPPISSPAHLQVSPISSTAHGACHPHPSSALVPARVQPFQSLCSSWIRVCNSTGCQAAEYTWVCSLLRWRPRSAFFPRVNARIVSPSSWQTPRYSGASLRDPTCILSALSLLTPWILQSPVFPSWVSELRERRDSGPCLSIKRTPGCCLPFVLWWWRVHRHRAICFSSWLDFKQNVLGVSLSGRKALQLGSLLLSLLPLKGPMIYDPFPSNTPISRKQGNKRPTCFLPLKVTLSFSLWKLDENHCKLNIKN